MHSLKFTFTLATLLGSTLAGHAEDGAYKEFKSWQVSCGQTRSCDMRQFLSGEQISSFELRRKGGPEAPVVLILSPSDNAVTEAEGAPTASIAIDGAEPLVLDGASVTADAGTFSFILTGDFIGNGLIDNLKNGTSATITIERGDKSAKAAFPLAGAAASLLFIDEYQDRIDHVDALSAKGDKAPNPPLPLSDIGSVNELPEAIRPRFAAGGECAETDATMFDGNALAHKIDENTTIYITPCGMSGPYNVPYTAMVDSFGMISTLSFPTMVDGLPSATPQAFNLAYDWEKKSLSSFFKGRGIGDCGTYSQWRLAEGAMGPQLVLVKETFRDCPGEISETDEIDPDSWPKTWPLK
jgi:invasion protein IalB